MQNLVFLLTVAPVLLVAYGLPGLIAGYLDASLLWCLVPIPVRLAATARKAWTAENKVKTWFGNWLFEGFFFSIPSLFACLLTYYLGQLAAGR